MKILYSGKSKDVFESEEPDILIMVFKDEMRTADGRHFSMEEKGFTLAEISASIFSYLSKSNIENHFIQSLGEKSFLVKKLKMLPFEFVVRRFAEGSYLKRNPETKHHERFTSPVFEIFYKDDILDDPIVVLKDEQNASLHQQKLPISQTTFIKEIKIDKINLEQVKEKSIEVFLLLEKLFSQKNAILCDLKLEFGIDNKGNIVLGDSIEPDCWRLWLGDINLDRNDGYEKEFDNIVIHQIKEKYKLAKSFIKDLS